MKTRNKNKEEKALDAKKVADANAACVKACKEFRQEFYDYEMAVDHMAVGTFLAINRGAWGHECAVKRAAQPKVGECHEDDTTYRHFYEEKE